MSLSAWRYSPVPRGYDGGVLNVAVPRTPDQVALDLSREQFRAYDAHLADRRIAALAETVNLLRDRGLQVMLWMPPLRQDVQSYFAEFRLEAEKDRLAASLRKIAPLVDSVLEPGIGNIRFVFIDPVHTDNGPAILAELLRSTSR